MTAARNARKTKRFPLRIPRLFAAKDFCNNELPPLPSGAPLKNGKAIGSPLCRGVYEPGRLFSWLSVGSHSNPVGLNEAREGSSGCSVSGTRGRGRRDFSAPKGGARRCRPDGSSWSGRKRTARPSSIHRGPTALSPIACCGEWRAKRMVMKASLRRMVWSPSVNFANSSARKCPSKPRKCLGWPNTP
jgi:hypothetical protein